MSDIHYNFAEVAFSGAIAGGCRAVSRALTYPLDTLKTRQQVSPEKTGAFSFTASDFSRMFSKDYFKGVLPAVLSSFPANSAFFSVYYFLLALSATSCFHGSGNIGESAQTADALLFFERLVFSCIATVPQNAIKVPAELIKQRAQVEPNLSLIDLFMEAMSDPKVGIRGLFVGSNAQLLREVPFNAIQMSTFQFFKDNFLGQGADGRLIAVFGLLSAAFAALLTQPADVIKSRMMVRQPKAQVPVLAAGSSVLGFNSTLVGIPQSSGCNAATTTATSATTATVDSAEGSNLTAEGGLAPIAYMERPKTIAECFRSIIKERGVAGLYVGLVPRLLLVGFGGMIYFASAEYAQSFFEISFSSAGHSNDH
jgi:hypothetical protein